MPSGEVKAASFTAKGAPKFSLSAGRSSSGRFSPCTISVVSSGRGTSFEVKAR